MSWKDNLNQVVFTIVTGDKKEYTPKWQSATKDVDYNTALFEFVNVEGTLVLRKKPKGRKFELEFYFDGENAVEIGESFEKSARDNRNWTVKHPFFGNFQCQPLSLKQDNTVLNISKFNVPVIETITKIYPSQNIVIVDKISEYAIKTNISQAQSFAGGEINKSVLKENVNILDRTYSKIISSDSELVTFKKIVSDAVVAIDSAISTPLIIIRSIQAVINYPATIVQTVKSRFNTLNESLEGLINSFNGTRADKFKIESLGGSIISSMTIASSTNITNDYDLRNDIVFQQSNLISAYNRYLAFLDSQQTVRADNNLSFIPNFTGINDLNTVLNLTVANLLDLIFEAKQEREFILEKDSNIILLTHRFYSLDVDDLNIDKFMKTNNIGINEILNIRKGRKILYYV